MKRRLLRLTMREAIDGTMRPSAQMFIDGLMANPVNAELLRRLPSLGLNECFLTAGCLFQATWNHISGHPASWGVKDYDVFYFDANDVSWEAEDAVIRRARTQCNGPGDPRHSRIDEGVEFLLRVPHALHFDGRTLHGFRLSERPAPRFELNQLVAQGNGGISRRTRRAACKGRRVVRLVGDG
jgi:hypothetical protein